MITLRVHADRGGDSKHTCSCEQRFYLGSDTRDGLFPFMCFFYVSKFSALNTYSFINRKTKIKMTNLDPERLQLPPTSLSPSVYSLAQIKRMFFSLTRSPPFRFVSPLLSFTPTTFLQAFSSEPSFLMRRKLAGLHKPHASFQTDQLHRESLGARPLPTAT